MNPWRIYYEDHTFNYTEGLPARPDDKWGVLVIAQRRSDGHYHTVYGADYYIFQGSFWVPVKENGLIDWVVHHLEETKCAIVGRAVPHGYYNEIFAQAKEAVRKGSLG